MDHWITLTFSLYYSLYDEEYFGFIIYIYITPIRSPISFSSSPLESFYPISKMLDSFVYLYKPGFSACPSFLSTTLDSRCRGSIFYSQIWVDDNCDGNLVKITQVSGPLNGSTISLGTYLAVFLADDVSGNSARCNTEVRAKDVTPPTVQCPSQTIVLNASHNACSGVFSLPNIPYHDNCGNVTLSLPGSLYNGSLLDVGIYEFPMRVYDGSANSAQCIIKVEIMDTQAPLLSKSNVWGKYVFYIGIFYVLCT